MINAESCFSGFYFLFKDIADENVITFKDPGSTFMMLIQMTLGEFKVSLQFFTSPIISMHY